MQLWNSGDMKEILDVSHNALTVFFLATNYFLKLRDFVFFCFLQSTKFLGVSHMLSIAGLYKLYFTYRSRFFLSFSFLIFTMLDIGIRLDLIIFTIITPDFVSMMVEPLLVKLLASLELLAIS